MYLIIGYIILILIALIPVQIHAKRVRKPIKAYCKLCIYKGQENKTDINTICSLYPIIINKKETWDSPKGKLIMYMECWEKNSNNNCKDFKSDMFNNMTKPQEQLLQWAVAVFTLLCIYGITSFKL